MGGQSFIFKWDHPAKEAYVTGTFDDWSKSVQLQKTGSHWEKHVDLPKAEKVYYKVSSISLAFWINKDQRIQTTLPPEGR